MPTLRELDYQIAETLFRLPVFRRTGTFLPMTDGYGASIPVPAYSRDKAAAEQVISKMKELGFAANCESKQVGPVKMFQVRIRDCDGQELGVSSWSETEATAICLAVVKPLGLQWPEAREGVTP